MYPSPDAKEQLTSCGVDAAFFAGLHELLHAAAVLMVQRSATAVGFQGLGPRGRSLEWRSRVAGVEGQVR